MANDLIFSIMEETETKSPSKPATDDNMGSNSLEPPVSPSSSSATSCQDTTYLPTIDDLVNDFDDEQTLNEEEALAALEETNPADEIATLKEESEMPIEELLAKYKNMPPLSMEEFAGPPPKKMKRPKKRVKNKEIISKSSCDSDAVEVVPETTADAGNEAEVSDVNVIIDSPEPSENTDKKADDEEHVAGDANVEDASENMILETVISQDDAVPGTSEEKSDNQLMTVESPPVPTEENIFHIQPPEKVKIRRSHLLDLYPDHSFVAVVGGEGDGKTIPLEQIYCEDEDDEFDVEDDEDGDGEGDQTKKSIMIGSAFQATIPDGLSQYGDILPYENEDKLIWEPSQVSEAEVEEYLLKARDIKPTLSDDEAATDSLSSIGIRNTNERVEDSNEILPAASTTNNIQGGDVNAAIIESESGVVKDDEQSLHLLVQCGYDFKEALRRKRLNALPLTGSMSIWSEEECQKFEEGIQKYGKDFLKIRQNLVRTRSMRELVQFYYLWKKSERRDNNFANSDTVDHMDIYLNEGGDYGSTNTNVTGFSTLSSCTNVRRANGCMQKSFSIMTGGHNSCNVNPNATNVNSSNTITTHMNMNRRPSDNSNSIITPVVSHTETDAAH